MSEQLINGIDVQKLNETIETIKKNTELAKFKFMVKNNWVNANHSRITIKEFFQGGKEDDSRKEPMVFELDEPYTLLGENTGPNPVEFILLALSGCLTSALVNAASVKRIELRSVESYLEGDLDIRGFLRIAPEVRNGYQDIRVIFKIDADVAEDQIKELVEIAQQTSPVFDIVTNKVPVRVEFEKG